MCPAPAKNHFYFTKKHKGYIGFSLVNASKVSPANAKKTKPKFYFQKSKVQYVKIVTRKDKKMDE